MPVRINGKTYEDHDSAVSALKRSKPSIKDPDAYVATVERAEKGAKMLSCPDCGWETGSQSAMDRHSEHQHGKVKNAIDYGDFEGKGSPCPECAGKGRAYRMNCPTCEGTGKQMFPFHKASFGNETVRYKGDDECSICGLTPSEHDKKGDLNHSFKAPLSAKSHPFNRLAKENKTLVLIKAAGISYRPYSDNPVYENLDYPTRKAVDGIFNAEKVGILSEKIQRLASMDGPPQEGFGTSQPPVKTTTPAFSGNAKHEITVTGADAEKPKEKPSKVDPDYPFSFEGAKYKDQRLSKAIRDAVLSEFEDNIVKVKETQGKGDPQNEPLKDGGTVNVPDENDDTQFNYMGANQKQAADYPWEQCIRDQTKKYGDKETAQKVCGKIKAKYGKYDYSVKMAALTDDDISPLKTEQKPKLQIKSQVRDTV